MYDSRRGTEMRVRGEREAVGRRRKDLETLFAAVENKFAKLDMKK